MSAFGVHKSDCLCPECWADSREREAHQPQPLPLKPCPFCGGDADVEAKPLKYKLKKVWIICPTPGCGMALGEHRTVEKAIAAWNQRPERDLTAPSGEGDALAFLIAAADPLTAQVLREDGDPKYVPITTAEALRAIEQALTATATKLADAESDYRRVHRDKMDLFMRLSQAEAALKSARAWIVDTDEDENPEEWLIVKEIDATLKGTPDAP